MKAAHRPSHLGTVLFLPFHLLPASAFVLPERDGLRITTERRQSTLTSFNSSAASIPIESRSTTEFSFNMIFSLTSPPPTSPEPTSTPFSSFTTSTSSGSSLRSVLPTSSASLASISTTNSPSLSFTDQPTNTSQPNFAESSSSVLPAIIGGVIGCLAAFTTVICILLFRRRRKRKHVKEKQRKAIQPFVASPSAPLRLATDALPSKSFLSSLPSSSSQNMSISSPTSTMSEQGLLEHLNMLKAQVQRYEELVRIAGVVTSSVTDVRSSEPPPEYVASVTQPVNSEKSR